MMLILRRYKPSDLPAVWALRQLASQVAGVPAPERYFSDLHHIEAAFLTSGGAFVVAAYERQIVAMGGLKRTSAHRAEIIRMRVHPNFQRRGWGSTIFSKETDCNENKQEYRPLCGGGCLHLDGRFLR